MLADTKTSILYKKLVLEEDLAVTVSSSYSDMSRGQSFLDIDVVLKDPKNEEKVLGNPNAENFEFYINPRIEYATKKSLQEGEEGCLSIPEIRLIAERFDKIKVI